MELVSTFSLMNKPSRISSFHPPPGSGLLEAAADETAPDVFDLLSSFVLSVLYSTLPSLSSFFLLFLLLSFICLSILALSE
jgi:hypothetical protein